MKQQKRRPWTHEEIASLRVLYPDYSAAVVGKVLGRLPGSVHAKAGLLKLTKSEAFMTSSRSGRIQRGKKDEAMKATQFKPGNQPWNKGISYQAGGDSVKTQFKPGMRPHTWQPIGTYRVVIDKTNQKHLERKTSDCAGPNHMRWTPVARIVWEQANGPVPNGHMVVFKRGMKTTVLQDITLDKLDCITRAEHARRNHPGRQNPELAKLYQLKGAITRQVNRINKEAQETQETRA